MKTKNVVLSGLLCAMGIIIPMFSPLKIVLEPASFTLASHIPIFISMFISSKTALFVTLGSTIGFFFGGFPLPVVARAFSHLLFVSIGCLYLKKNNNFLKDIKSSLGYSFVIAIIHSIGEILSVMPFYFSNNLAEGFYDKGFLVSVMGLIGVGTIIHSMVDFSMSVYIWNMLPKDIRGSLEVKKVS